MHKKLENYLKSKKIKENPNVILTSQIKRGLEKNIKRFGSPYCPCKVITGDIQIDSKNVCPCEGHIEEIKKKGMCVCGFLMKGELWKEN